MSLTYKERVSYENVYQTQTTAAIKFEYCKIETWYNIVSQSCRQCKPDGLKLSLFFLDRTHF